MRTRGLGAEKWATTLAFATAWLDTALADNTEVP